MKTPPLKLPPLPQTKAGRIKLGGGVAAALVLLIILFGSSDKPKQEEVIVPQVAVQEEAAVEKPVPVPPNANNSQIILELFNPSDQSLTNQITTTTLSQQIEQTMTVSFVLTKCQMISQDDYKNIFRALIMYAQQSKLAVDEPAADAAVRQITESAKASYSLVYSRTSCTDKQLPILADQVLKWTQEMFKPR